MATTFFLVVVVVGKRRARFLLRAAAAAFRWRAFTCAQALNVRRWYLERGDQKSATRNDDDSITLERTRARILLSAASRHRSI